MRQSIHGNTHHHAPRLADQQNVSRTSIEDLLTVNQAQELFALEDGVLINRVMRGRRAKPGAIAGSPNGDGYLRVRVNGRQFRVHRIVWLMTFGKWPVGQIDHINGIRHDNRIENMREVDAQGNQRNQHIRPDNTSGVTGVVLERGLWAARIKVDGKKFRLGRFKTKDEAAAARKAAEIVLGFHPNHGATDEARRSGRRSISAHRLLRIA